MTDKKVHVVLDWKHLNTLSAILNGNIFNIDKNIFGDVVIGASREVALA